MSGKIVRFQNKYKIISINSRDSIQASIKRPLSRKHTPPSQKSTIFFAGTQSNVGTAPSLCLRPGFSIVIGTDPNSTCYQALYTFTRMWIGQGKPKVAGDFRLVQQILTFWSYRFCGGCLWRRLANMRKKLRGAYASGKLNLTYPTELVYYVN